MKKKANGLLKQWGKSEEASGDTEQTIYFPINFSNSSSYTVNRTILNNEDWDQDTNASYVIKATAVYSITASSFIVWSPNGYSTHPSYWIAIGY